MAASFFFAPIGTKDKVRCLHLTRRGIFYCTAEWLICQAQKLTQSGALPLEGARGGGDCFLQLPHITIVNADCGIKSEAIYAAKAA